MKKLLGIFVFLMMFSLLPISKIHATAGGTLNSTEFYCDAVVVNLATYYNYDIRIYDGPDPNSDTLLGSITSVGDFGLTAYTDIIVLNTTVPENTMLYLFVFDGIYDITSYMLGAGAKSGNCSGLYFPPSETPPEAPVYRQFGGVGSRAAIFVVDEDNGSNNPVLTIYDVNENSQGTLLFYISLNALNTQYPVGETQLLYKNTTEYVWFYRMATGELQLNLGPDAEGKVHVIRFTWDGGLPTNVTYDTYFVELLLPSFLIMAG